MWRNNPINLQQIRDDLREHLEQNGDETPANTSLVLLAHILQRSKSWILSHGEYQLTRQEDNTIEDSLSKLIKGVPLPYILGQWEFYGRMFRLTSDVLIPRPETELMVELALGHTVQRQKPLIVDVGTGSGAIAISLAAELSDAHIIGIDISLSALQVAQANAQRICPSKVGLFQTDLLTPFSVKFDLICANLPYIPRQRLSSLDVSKWEPHLALDGGESGMEFIHKLLKQAQTRLSPIGVILLEIDSDQGAETTAAAQQAFPEAQCQMISDLAGLDRIVEIRQG